MSHPLYIKAPRDEARNTNLREMFSTIDLLSKVDCFVSKVNDISMKFGTVEDDDLGIVFMYVCKNSASGWPPEARKYPLAKP